MKTFLREISLHGFRAYLAKQTFDLSPNKSMAVFAANAKGKSSLVDAVEFFFSSDGTLRRLGERRSGTHAGPDALAHVQAEKKKIVPSVTLTFVRGTERCGDERKVTRPPSAIPKSAKVELDRCKHDFIIRGYELRRFVESQTPEERYREVAAWFGLSPLINVQKNLQSIRRRMKEMAESEATIKLRIGDLVRATNKAITTWSEQSLATWVNSTYLKPLDSKLEIKSLSADDDTFAVVRARKAQEADSLGLTALNELRDAAYAVCRIADEGESGALIAFEAASTAARQASETEALERINAEKSVFNNLWNAAKKLFEDDTLVISKCPVCDTAFELTPQGSRAHVASHVTGNVEALASYNASLTSLRRAKQALLTASAKLKSTRDALLTLLHAGKLETEAAALSPYAEAIDSWKLGDPPPESTTARETLRNIAADAASRATAIEETQGEFTYTGAFAKLEELVRIADSVKLAFREKDELGKLQADLELSARHMEKDIAAHVASLLNELKDEINHLYVKIQGPGALPPSIRIEPPDREAKGQLTLNLLVDFAENRKGVIPGGYLSDSQVHTLALSMRLAAIKLFNAEFPLVVLDDIVTSYDADHRKSIASLLAEDFAEFQFIIVTHDERFFTYLKEHLPSGQWVFRQITHLEDGYGPKYIHHRVTDELIAEKLKNEEKAANDIRQAEEEWLLGKAREFGVDLRIRDVDRPYAYNRGELAIAMAAFLKGKKIATPVLPGFTNPFWTSLQQGTVENFGSHFQDDPNASGSRGDERKRWDEFTKFRELFRCPKCGHEKFKRAKVGVDRPLCVKCETPFNFKAPETGT